MKMKYVWAGAMAIAALGLLCGSVLAEDFEEGSDDTGSSYVIVDAESDGTEGSFEGAEDGDTVSGIAVMDMSGRSIIIDSPAERIVSLSPSGCEILNALGAAELLCGRAETCDFPEEILSVPAVPSGSDLNVEQILALSPSLVLADQGGLTEDTCEAVEAAGVPVAYCDAGDFDGVMEAISMVGALCGKERVAGYVTDGMRSTLEILDASVTHREGEPEKVYFEIASSDGGLLTAGSGTLLNEAAKEAGLVNIFEDQEGIVEAAADMIIERNPDHIVLLSLNNMSEPPREEEVLSREGWETVAAVQENSIKRFEGFELVRSGPRIVDGAVMLYEMAYGDEEGPLPIIE